MRAVWSADPHGVGAPAYAAIANGMVYADCDGGVCEWSLGSGAEQWQQPGATGPVSVSDGFVFGYTYHAGSKPLAVTEMEPTTGVVLWSEQINSPVFDPHAPPIEVGGLVYINTDDGVFYALHASDGSVAWSYGQSVNSTTSNGQPVVMDVVPAVASGVVYTSSNEGMLALAATTGQVLWTVGADEDATPVVDGDNLIVRGSAAGLGAGVLDYSIASCRVGSCTPRWEFGAPGSGPVAVSHGTVYAASDNVGPSDLVALDESAGAERWHFHSSQPVLGPIVADDVVLVGTFDGSLHALPAAGCGQATCSSIWDVPLGDLSADSADVVVSSVANGTLVVACFWGLIAFRVPSAGSGPALPSAPTGVSATPLGPSSVQLEWQPAEGNGLPVQRYNVTSSTGQTLHFAGYLTRAEIDNLKPSTTYRFTVSATTSAGTGPASQTSAATTPNGPLVAATGVTAVPGNGTLTVSWTAPATIGGSPLGDYTVLAGNQAAGQVAAVVSAAASATSATLAGLSNGSSYQVWVRDSSAGQAIESDAAGPYSPTRSGPAQGVSKISISSPQTAVFGDPVALRATVTSKEATPTGCVQFDAYAGSSLVAGGPCVPLQSGAATYTIYPPAGSYNVEARYNGDRLSAASLGSIGLTVTPVGTRTAAASQGAPVWGQPAQLAVSVSRDTSTGGPATGVIEVTEGSTVLIGQTTGWGTFSVPVPGLAAGSHSLSVRNNGDSNDGPSSAAPVDVTIARASAIVGLRLGSPVGGKVIVTVPVGVRSPASGVPTGNVSISEDGQTIATAPLSSGGLAKASIPLAGGSHQLQATYLGDSNVSSAVSASASVGSSSGGSGGSTSGSTSSASAGSGPSGGGSTGQGSGSGQSGGSAGQTAGQGGAGTNTGSSGSGSSVGPGQGSGSGQSGGSAGQTAGRGGAGTNTGSSGLGSTLGPGSGIAVARVAGADRVTTAIAVSRAAFGQGSAGAVVLARDDSFADALAGGPLAAHMGGPLLLTDPAGLPSATEAEIARVLPAGGTVYIVGGTSGVSIGVESTLGSAGYHVTRLAGVDRYATAVAVARAVGTPQAVFEATGTDYPDALAGVPAAIADHGVILLTDGSSQAPETAQYVAGIGGVSRYAVGGQAAAADPGATAVFGSDRYATAAAVATRFFSSPTVVGVASGSSFPDALGAGPYLGANDTPLLLTPPDGALPSSVLNYLVTTTSLTSAQVFGGTGAVSDQVVGEVGAA